MIALLQGIARLVCGSPPPRTSRTPPGVRRGDLVADRWPAFVPAGNPLETAEGYQARQDAAMRMMDPDCYGFLLISVHKEQVGLRAEIEMRNHVDPSWWPAIGETLSRIAQVAREEA